jgi:putative addiction module killer protein
MPVGARARIQARVARFEYGNLGDCKSVGNGVHEARIHAGPGYRVYFAFDGSKIILLLLGGDKGSQRKDIQRSQEFWRDYRNRR